MLTDEDMLMIAIFNTFVFFIISLPEIKIDMWLIFECTNLSYNTVLWERALRCRCHWVGVEFCEEESFKKNWIKCSNSYRRSKGVILRLKNLKGPSEQFFFNNFFITPHQDFLKGNMNQVWSSGAKLGGKLQICFELPLFWRW